MKLKLKQEEAESSFSLFSASSAISSSNAFCPYWSKSMKPRLEQEAAVVAESSFSVFSAFSAISCSNAFCPA